MERVTQEEKNLTPPIRIAFVIAEMRIGGAEKALAELLLGLNLARFTPVLYILRPESFHNGVSSFLPALYERGIPIHFLNLSRWSQLPQAMRRFRRLLREQKPDILHSWMFHANILGRWGARRAGVPVVISGIRVAEKEHRVHLWLDRLTSSWVDYYLCVSRSAADWTIQEGKIPPRKVNVIPNAASFPSNLSRQEGYNPPLPPFFDDPTAKRILFTGRLTRQKGLDWLLATVPEWLDKEWASGWILGLAGEGSEEESLKRQAAALPPNLAKRIHFLGWRPDISALMEKSDLLILPSRYEGMPNVLLEAAACGRAVLSSRCDGVEEILGPFAVPQTFPFGDLDQWRAKLRPLLENEDFRRDLGGQNKERVLAEFSPSKIIERYQIFWVDAYQRAKSR